MRTFVPTRTLASLLPCVAACVISLPGIWNTEAAGTASADEVMPSYVSANLGLAHAWSRTTATPYGEQSIADIQLYVHGTEPHQYVEIVSQSAAKKDSSSPATVLARYWTDKTDRLGKPLGQAESERLASNEIRRLKRRGIEAKMQTSSSPRIRLYSIANDGTLQARNAETGEPIWLTRVGDSQLTYSRLGINDEHIAVINGSNLILVDVANGNVVTEFRLDRTPIFGAINSGGFAMVLSITGGITCYKLDDMERDPFYERVSGAPLTSPTRAPQSTKVAWSTDRGYVYVMELDGRPSTQFRLKTDGLVTGKIAATAGDHFYFGSESGQVYAVTATRTGLVNWSIPFGEPFEDEPVIVEDQLFITSTYGNLFCLSTETGSPLWPNSVPGIDHIVGAFGDRVYVTLTSGMLAVVNRESGDVVGTFPSVVPARELKNALTDRLYLVNDNAVVQCLRPEASELPLLMVPSQIAAGKNEEDGKIAAAEEAKPADGGSVFDGGGNDPFGAEAIDPFGGGGEDPFGAGGGDPFGAGGGMQDPFGEDPFGN